MGYAQIGADWGRILGSAVVTAALVLPLKAQAAEIAAWAFEETTSELRFSLPQSILPRFFLLAEPARIVLDIPEAQVGAIAPEQTYHGPIERIRVSQFSANAVRIVIDLAPGTILEPAQAEIQFDDTTGQRQWRFRPLIVEMSTPVASTVPRDPSATAELGLGVATPPAAAEPSTVVPASMPTLATAPMPDLATPSGTEDAPNLEAISLAGAEEISLSAASLQGETVTTSATQQTLPIDPYEPQETTTIVSVPPLAALPTPEATPTSSLTTTEAGNSAILPGTGFDNAPPPTDQVAAQPEAVAGVQPAMPPSAPPVVSPQENSAQPRTITQTRWPEPIQFGQPLPD